MFAWHDRDLLAAPLYQKNTLAEPDNIRGRQVAGTVKLHPTGRFAYVANRASTARDGVFVGGENNLAVFALDQTTGEPSLIQNIDTRGIHCRNFHIDPSGRSSRVAHSAAPAGRDTSAVTNRSRSAAGSVYRINPDFAPGAEVTDAAKSARRVIEISLCPRSALVCQTSARRDEAAGQPAGCKLHERNGGFYASGGACGSSRPLTRMRLPGRRGVSSLAPVP